jgi:hypothetical protein
VAPKKRGLSRSQIILVLSLIIIVGGTTYAAILYAQPSYQSTAINWSLKITFFDAKTGQNTTLPDGIGVVAQYWLNHTLDRYGRPGYSPLTTQDSTSTVHIQTNIGLLPNGSPLVFTFADFFFVWGQRFDHSCVWSYCTKPAEDVVYDTNGNGLYDAGEPIVNFNLTQQKPANGTPLATDPHIKYYDADHNGVWDTNETVVYDTSSTNLYASSDPTIAGTSLPPVNGPLSTDPKLMYVESDNNNVWDPGVPPPVMSDGKNERCVNGALLLSNGKDWVIALNTTLGAQLGCKP